MHRFGNSRVWSRLTTVIVLDLKEILDVALTVHVGSGLRGLLRKSMNRCRQLKRLVLIPR